MTLHVYEDSHSLWIKTFNFTFSILFFRIDVIKIVAYRALLNSFAAHAPDMQSVAFKSSSRQNDLPRNSM